MFELIRRRGEEEESKGHWRARRILVGGLVGSNLFLSRAAPTSWLTWRRDKLANRRRFNM